MLLRTKCTVLLPPAPPNAEKPQCPAAVRTRPAGSPLPRPAHPEAQPLSSRVCHPPVTARNARWREPQRSGASLTRPGLRRHRRRLPTPPTHSRESKRTSRENDPVAEPAQKEQGGVKKKKTFPRALEGKAAGRLSRDAETPFLLARCPVARGSF